MFINDRLSTFLTLPKGKRAIMQRSRHKCIRDDSLVRVKSSKRVNMRGENEGLVAALGRIVLKTNEEARGLL